MADVKPGEGTYAVTAAVAVVRLLDGSERYVYRNGRFDAAGADAASVAHLESVGLVRKEPVPVEGAETTETPKDPEKSEAPEDPKPATRSRTTK
ncbi:hypothetical protein [Gulosibacter molinativorax]|uniref:hypothetical protein n=1 Tax=Gulosibacter molinativorax TaxID=256821 RepID=UPI000D0B526E|nr:hypothetical protein [Gulosibacter molinativorax]QUY63347.1 Hypotetical protein [Gulosibacter molinativorax]